MRMEDCAANAAGKGLALAGEKPVRPFDKALVVLTKTEHIALKSGIARWENLHGRALDRVAKLERENEELKAKIRELEQRLFGKRSEAGAGSGDVGRDPGPRRKRGQQRGHPGHGRAPVPDLPEITETLGLAPEDARCKECGLPYEPFPGTEDSRIYEVAVTAHTRRIRRKRYRKTCQCRSAPGIIAAPPAPRLVPKSRLGVSVWAMILADKYRHGIPLQRICERLAGAGLPLSPGTVTGGLRQLKPLFEPLAGALLEKQLHDRLVNADETRWMVFELVGDKPNHKWQVWVVRSASVVYYRIAPSRGACVLEDYFTRLEAMGVTRVTVVCDRHSAYKSLAKSFTFIVLAFCWVHVRRDFLNPAKSRPELREWFLDWAGKIGRLYQLNHQRLEHWDGAKRLNGQSADFKRAHRKLCRALHGMAVERDRLLREGGLQPAQAAPLESLRNHWKGLTVFRGHPEVPMDNNRAETAIRPWAVARNTYYGSGSMWSAELAAMLVSQFQTVRLWGLNAEHWLRAYLEACAENGGKAPEDLSLFLPWEMDEARLRHLSRPWPEPRPPPRGDTS